MLAGISLFLISEIKKNTLFLDRKEIAVSFLVLENPSRKSGARNVKNTSNMKNIILLYRNEIAVSFHVSHFCAEK